MDPDDQMERVYEAFVQWGDIFIMATPIRGGQASSLYYKMVERMNCIQNQETIASRHLLRKKVGGLIITGGQDNIQSVAGQMLTFFGELGCQFPKNASLSSRNYTPLALHPCLSTRLYHAPAGFLPRRGAVETKKAGLPRLAQTNIRQRLF